MGGDEFRMNLEGIDDLQNLFGKGEGWDGFVRYLL